MQGEGIKTSRVPLFSDHARFKPMKNEEGFIVRFSWPEEG